MKTKLSKYFYDSNYSSDLIKVAIVILLIAILLVGAANLFSSLISMLFD